MYVKKCFENIIETIIFRKIFKNIISCIQLLSVPTDMPGLNNCVSIILNKQAEENQLLRFDIIFTIGKIF